MPLMNRTIPFTQKAGAFHVKGGRLSCKRRAPFMQKVGAFLMKGSLVFDKQLIGFSINLNELYNGTLQAVFLKSGDLLLRKSDESLLRKFDDAKLLVTIYRLFEIRCLSVGWRIGMTSIYVV